MPGGVCIETCSQRRRGAEAHLRFPRFLAAMAVLVCLWNAVFSQLEAGDPVRGSGARPFPVQRPPMRGGAEGPAQPVSRAQSPESVSAAKASEKQPIFISAKFGSDWQPAQEGGRIHLLRGEVAITQGSSRLTATQGAVWIQSLGPQSARQRVRIYLEGDVGIVLDQSTRTASAFSAEWMTAGDLNFDVTKSNHANQSQARELTQDPVLQRALKRWQNDTAMIADAVRNTRTDSAVHRAGGVEAITETYGSAMELDSDSLVFGKKVEAKPAGQRRLRFFSRSQTPFNLYSSETANTNPVEQIMVITGGVNLVIDGVEETGAVDLRADHMVIWTQAMSEFDDQAAETRVQNGDAPLQIYLEGNIVVNQNDPKQGTKTKTRAQRAFFDIREKRAILRDVEIKVTTPAMPLSIRIRAEEVRQQSEASFHAMNAWVTTSQFGKPGYRIQSSDVLYEARPNPKAQTQASATKKKRASSSNIQQVSGQQPDSNEAAGVAPEPTSGVPEPQTTPWVTAVNPIFKVEDLPVFMLPRLSGPVGSAATPLRKLTFENDRVFGQQLRTGFDLFKVFGQEAPDGVDAMVLADYLGSRGPALGLLGQYDIEDRAGWGDGRGLVNAYGIDDGGKDNLGLGRRTLTVPDPLRGRLLLRDRQEFGDEFTLMTELGYISDRNFLEQYFEPEWDTGKDNETLAYLKQQRGDWAWTAMGRDRINDFDTTTSWLPKGDLYVLGRSFFDGRVNVSSHSSVGYGHLQPAVAPTDPADIFSPLPYVADRQGLVAMTRNEISAPLHLGPLNIVPYAMGEADYWGQALDGNSMGRLYGRAGVRGSMMMTKVMPDVQSTTFGLRGLVHKMIFDFDYSISDSSQNLSDVAQYNEFDDQAQYRFRNRLLIDTFGGVLPSQFDPRFYAVRAGAGSSVTAPYYELVDSQQVLRMGWRHRLQTQAGPIDNPRIRDWMTLDLEASYFPNAQRDDFGQSFGLIGGRYAWNISERTSILANAQFDLFTNAQQIANIGVLSQRSERGSMYVGVRQVKGAGLDSEILTTSYSYQMSPNYISTFGAAYDLAEGRNRGESITLTRVGKDFLFNLGANYDASKNNVGVIFSITPRFLPGNSTNNQSNPQLGSLLGGGF
ncbi:MAG: hypothetical protein JWM11_7327 [Planctomycetaceae bacterium]|nr:hypothetical protein [Planctomycetaceae bacterium]